jgi:hypothetical protein
LGPDFSPEYADRGLNRTSADGGAHLRKEKATMRKFDYRAPRFLVDLPIRLTFEDSMQEGRCREISTEGMKLEVRQPLSPDSAGTVRLRYHEFSIDLPVRVAHSGSSYDGVKFVFESDEQREDVSRLVALLAGPKQRFGPLLLR